MSYRERKESYYEKKANAQITIETEKECGLQKGREDDGHRPVPHLICRVF